MPERTWNVGILGLGHWYSAFGLARGLAGYRRAKLVGAAWHVPEQLDEFCRDFGVEGYAGYDDLLAREDVDIVLLAPPVSEMAECAVRAAEAGKHIVLGKPMAMTRAEADRMVHAVERAGVVCIPFQAIMRLRAAPIAERVRRGEIGDLILVHQTARWSIAEDWYGSGRPGWFADPRHVPGGALIDEGIYWFDLVRWIVDSPVAAVEARVANLVHRDVEVEDWGMAAFTFENGVFSTLEGSWTINAPRKTGPSPKHNSVVRTEIVGTKGEIIEQWFRDPGLAVLSAGAENWVFERQAGIPFAQSAPEPLDHLIDVLEGKKKPIATIHDAREAFSAMMAAYESARQRTS
jgi:predicted dehydrogenase